MLGLGRVWMVLDSMRGSSYVFSTSKASLAESTGNAKIVLAVIKVRMWLIFILVSPFFVILFGLGSIVENAIFTYSPPFD
ncbi:hypothetical protein VDG1235_1200 [Verrucomicrobiia bacterium DG1235]|nr:hypothetical protein VDG1235_1200 [Verrucomicrobiae bacterium DG1235]